MSIYTKYYKKFEDDRGLSPFSTALRYLMAKEGTTQEAIAKVTGKTRQTVSQYVNGISEPSYDTLVKIADYYDVSLDYLLGRTEDPSRIPSATEEIGLTSDAISVLKNIDPVMDRYCLDGLNTLLENKKMLRLAGSIDLLRRKVNKQMALPESSKKQLYLTEQVKIAKLSLEFSEWIDRKYPDYYWDYELLTGNRLIVLMKQEIIEEFEEILNNITGYNIFKKSSSFSTEE